MQVRRFFTPLSSR